MITKTLLALIISFEGFHPVAYWDHSQWTNGYGTKAIYAQERVSEREAKKRLEKDVAKRSKFVKKHAPYLNENEHNALVSFCYNVGLGACKKSVLLVAEGKKPAASWVMRKYTNNGNKGLVKRRKIETDLLMEKPKSKICIYQEYFDNYLVL